MATPLLEEGDEHQSWRSQVHHQTTRRAYRMARSVCTFHKLFPMTMKRDDEPHPDREDPAPDRREIDPKGYCLRHLIDLLLRQWEPKLARTDGPNAVPGQSRPDGAI
jgi:hypothetical protein